MFNIIGMCQHPKTNICSQYPLSKRCHFNQPSVPLWLYTESYTWLSLSFCYNKSKKHQPLTRQDRTSILDGFSPISAHFPPNFHIWYPILCFSAHMFTDSDYFHLFSVIFHLFSAMHLPFSAHMFLDSAYFPPMLCSFSAYFPPNLLLIFRRSCLAGYTRKFVPPLWNLKLCSVYVKSTICSTMSEVVTIKSAPHWTTKDKLTHIVCTCTVFIQRAHSRAFECPSSKHEAFFIAAA